MHYAFTQQGLVTNLVGMNIPAILESNLSVLYDGLNQNEEQVLNEIKEK